MYLLEMEWKGKFRGSRPCKEARVDLLADWPNFSRWGRESRA